MDLFGVDALIETIQTMCLYGIIAIVGVVLLIALLVYLGVRGARKRKGIAGASGDFLDKMKEPISDKIPIPKGMGVSIGFLAIFFVGYIIAYNEVGYWRTPAGIGMIILLLVSVILYVALAVSGAKTGGIFGAISIIAMIFALLLVFMGLLPVLQEWAISLLPYLLLIGLGWTLYQIGKKITDPEVRTYYVIGIVVLLIATPLFHIFVAPTFIGDPVEIEIQMSLSESGGLTVDAVIQPMGVIRTSTSTFNPYSIALAEVSSYMWYSAGTQEKYFVDIQVEDMLKANKNVYNENNKEVYLTRGSDTTIWGALTLDANDDIHYKYRLVVEVYDSNNNYILTEYSMLTNIK